MQAQGAAFTLSRLLESPLDMLLRPPSRLLVLACLSGLVAGCDRAPSASPGVSPPIRIASAQEAAADEDAGKGNGYAFHIRYPRLPSDWQALTDALRGYANARKKELIDSTLADEGANAPPNNLDLEFNIARRTVDFVSVLANGSLDSGGAHPAPVVASFNLHTDDGKVLTLSDLFTDGTAALGALSNEARRQLEGRYEAKLRETTPARDQAAALTAMHDWVRRGTEPTAANFAVFLVDGLEAKAIGMTLIFPPYQVASFADGTQQVEIPAKVFYQLLKPEYRDSFQIDTEADKLAPGVR
jgi:hypothetical protein